jgi:signal transduction histidine kinase
MIPVDGSPDAALLRRCLSDVVALSTLSAIWAGASRATIANGLAEVLQDTLGADFILVSLPEVPGGPACEGVAASEGQVSVCAETIRSPIGIHGDYGVIVAVSGRQGFPSEIDRLLLNLAGNQATQALLTERTRELHAESERANTAKDQFLATLSHELRTPLNAIVGWLSMLRSPKFNAPADLPKAWSAIDRNTQALTELVEDLLDVSRIATGKIRLADADVDLNDVVRDGVRMIEPKFMEKGVTLTATLHPEPCRVRGDAARLRQVAGNLLSNAVKFTPAGGRVTVLVTCRDENAVLVVEDTGLGIPPDFLPHVFQRFRQGDAESAGGLGLGLAIVKNLVELHRGTVVAASEGVGRGARFTVTVPRLLDA